jgi:twitching motility two-component system response regulator PilG
VSAGTSDHEKTLVLRRTPTPTPAPAPAVTPARASPPASPALQGQRPAAAPVRSAPAVPEKKIKDWVLVVDDSAMVRKFMARKLEPFAFGVDFAETGEEAVGMTGEKEYTCVFLDIVLPGIDGYQVCKLIKSNKQAITRTAIVMLTSKTSAFDKLRGSMAGCDEYLTKPIDENKLLEVIAKFLPMASREAV